MNKTAQLNKQELWKKMEKNSFNELFKLQPEKAKDLFQDLWNKMTPYPNYQGKKILFESTFLEWMYTVEGEIK